MIVTREPAVEKIKVEPLPSIKPLMLKIVQDQRQKELEESKLVSRPDVKFESQLINGPSTAPQPLPEVEINFEPLQ